MELLPYVQLRSADGGCIEAINNCRTLSYVAFSGTRRPHPFWQLASSTDCPDVCCGNVNAGDYTYPSDWGGNPAPWADPANPASWEFFGLMIDPGGITIEAGYGSRRMGESSLTRPAWEPRRLTIVGTIISSSCRGTAFGEDWLVRTFAGSGCRGGGGLAGRVLLHCADEADDEFALWAPHQGWTPRAELAGLDACDAAGIAEAVPLPALADGHVPSMIADTGFRDLLDLRLVALDQLDDEPMSCAEGKRVVLILDAYQPALWWPTDSTYASTLLIAEPFDPCACVPHDWASGVTPVDESPCGTCGLPCHCAPTPSPVTPLTLPSCYSQPLSTSRLAGLTPVLPWSVRAALVVSIYGGDTGLSNVRVELHDAIPGLPNPLTVEGCRAYSARRPCAVAEIAAVSPRSTLTIDGRYRRSTIACPNQPVRPADDLALGEWGAPFQHPVVECGRRYWVVLSADCASLPADSEVRVDFVPFEVA